MLSQALFRTVAMMVPDYGLIGEISLYSMGFIESRRYRIVLIGIFSPRREAEVI